MDTIVLDLDGTLVSSIERRIEKSYLKPHIFEELFVYMRPCAPTFVKFILKRFKHIYVWSDSELSYIRFIINLVFGKNAHRVDCILHRRDCNKSLKLYGVKKDLRYIKNNKPCNKQYISKMVLVDNMESNINKTQNYVVIKTLELEEDITPNFFSKDKELKRVMQTLEKMGIQQMVATPPPLPASRPAKSVCGSKSKKAPQAKASRKPPKTNKPRKSGSSMITVSKDKK